MQLFIDEYSKFHQGTSMLFAAQSSQHLEDHKSDIVEDLNMLVQMKVSITLFYDIPAENVQLQQYFLDSVPGIHIIRASRENDFCEEALQYARVHDKLIYLTGNTLVDCDGKRVNAISTQRVQEKGFQRGEPQGPFSYCDTLKIESSRVRDCLEIICKKVQEGLLPRTHFVPLKHDHAIMNELFSIDGVGTIIENDFSKPSIAPATPEEIKIIFGIFQTHENDHYLRPRSKEYILEHLSSFYTAHIDAIPVGCVEIKAHDKETYELAGLAVIKSFLNQKIGGALSQYVEKVAMADNKRIICVTRNPQLQQSLEKNGYKRDTAGKYIWRSSQSPGATLYIKEYS